MAFKTYEDALIDNIGGSINLSLLIGRYENTGGSTGGQIIPGSPTEGVPVNGSDGLLNIQGNGYFTPSSGAGNAVSSVVSYSSGEDRDIATITTAADQDGVYYLLCYQSGVAS